MKADPLEELQDLAGDLSQARREAAEERRLRSALIRGLGIIAAPRPPGEMTAEMLSILEDTVEFEDAFLLVATDEGDLVSWSSTDTRFEGTRWVPGAFFNRVLGGSISPVFDIDQIPEWASQSEEVRAGVTSALHVGISGGGYRTILVCTHAERGFFQSGHVRLMEGFVPLASQAMLNSSSYDLEERGREEQAAREKAESSLDLLDHAMDSIGVGVGIWKPSAGLVEASRGLAEMTRSAGGVERWWADVKPRVSPPGAVPCPRCGEEEGAGSVRVECEWEDGPGTYVLTFAGHSHDPEHGLLIGEVLLVSDVSDRERMSREVDVLSSVPASNPSPVLRADRAGVLTFANPGAAPLLDAWALKVGEPLPDQIRQRIRSAEFDGAVSVEVVAEGRVYDLLMVAAPKFGVVHLFGRDVTEARDIRVALEESEARTRLLIEASLDAVVTMDGSGMVVDWSPRAHELFGWTADEAVGRLMADLIIPESLRQAHQDGLKRYLQTGEGPVLGTRIEVPSVHKTGEEIPVELFIRVLETGDENERLFAGFIRDVREQKRATDELNVANSRLAALIESTPAGILVEDRAGCVTLANQYFCEMSVGSPSPDELQGVQAADVLAGFRQLVDDRTGPELPSPVPGDETSGISPRDLQLSDGRVIESERVPVGRGDGFIGHMWHFRDVTASREAERAVRKAQARDMELGQEIQDLFLRGRPPEGHSELEIAVLSEASRGLDGDFVDFIEHGDQVIDVLVGDVMGKGIPASLLGAATKASFARALARAAPGEGDLPSLEAVMGFVHGTLVERLIAVESFVTLVYTRFDFRKRELAFVDCGHPKTIHFSAKEAECRLLDGSDPPIGFLSQNEYTTHRVPFDAGDTFVLYSDGITETFSESGEMLGDARLLEVVRRHGHQSPVDVVSAIRELVEDFGDGTLARSDDLTLVVVQVRSPGLVDRDSTPPQIERRMVMPRDSRRLGEFRALLAAVAEEGLGTPSPGFLTEFSRAAQEAVTNAMRHSEPDDPASPLDVRVRVWVDRMELEVRYDGVSFEPKAVELPDITEYPEGGFGLYIIEQSVDDVAYGTSADGRNYIRLSKRIS